MEDPLLSTEPAVDERLRGDRSTKSARVFVFEIAVRDEDLLVDNIPRLTLKRAHPLATLRLIHKTEQGRPESARAQEGEDVRELVGSVQLDDHCAKPVEVDAEFRGDCLNDHSVSIALHKDDEPRCQRFEQARRPPVSPHFLNIRQPCAANLTAFSVPVYSDYLRGFEPMEDVW